MSVDQVQQVNGLKEVAGLVRSVFGSDQGQKLLQKLTELFVDVPLFDLNPRIQDYRVGKCDLVRELKMYINLTDAQLETQLINQEDPLGDD